MKRILTFTIAIVLASALALGAAGCKKGDSELGSNDSFSDTYVNVQSALPSTVDTHSNPSTAEDIPLAITASMKNSGEVSMYAMNNIIDDDLVNYFKDNCDGHLQYISVLWDSYPRRVVEDFASGKSPDVILTSTHTITKIITKGMVYNKSELNSMGIANLNHTAIKNAEIKTKNVSSYKGEVYSLDAEISPTLMLCNEDVLEKCGITVTPKQLYNEGKWNFESFISVLEQVCDPKNDFDGNDKPDYIGYSGWDNNWIITALDGAIIKDNPDSGLYADVDNEKVIHAAQVYHDLSVKGYINPSGGFSNGTTALFAFDSKNLAKDFYRGGYKFKWSLVPFPVSNDNKNGTVNGSYYGFCISKSSDNIQGAVNLVIAKSVYDETARRVNTEYDLENWVDDEGIKIIADARQKTINVFWESLGSNNIDQWSYWSALKEESANPAEVLQNYKRSFNSNIQLED